MHPNTESNRRQSEYCTQIRRIIESREQWGIERKLMSKRKEINFGLITGFREDELHSNQ